MSYKEAALEELTVKPLRELDEEWPASLRKWRPTLGDFGWQASLRPAPLGQ